MPNGIQNLLKVEQVRLGRAAVLISGHQAIRKVGDPGPLQSLLSGSHRKERIGGNDDVQNIAGALFVVARRPKVGFDRFLLTSVGASVCRLERLQRGSNGFGKSSRFAVICQKQPISQHGLNTQG
jgi:hypothetical protein